MEQVISVTIGSDYAPTWKWKEDPAGLRGSLVEHGPTGCLGKKWVQVVQL
jgi:hypothetical protein